MSEALELQAITPLSSIVAGNIRAEVARRGWSQSEFARRVGMKQPLINNRWLGKTPWTIDETEAVAHCLGLSIFDLIIDRANGNGAQPKLNAVSDSVHRLGLEPRTL